MKLGGAQRARIEEAVTRSVQAMGMPRVVQARREAVVIIGPVQIVLDILLARPDDLHRAIDLLGDLHGPDHAIDIEPAAKAASDQMVVNLDLLLGEAGDFGGGGLRPRQNLRSNPNLASVGADMHGAVHRLHGGVGEKRHLIDGLDFLGGPAKRLFHIAVLARDRAGLLRGGIEFANDIGGAELGVRSRVPFDIERGQTFPRRSHMIGYHGDGIVEPHNLMHALHRSAPWLR